MKDKKRHGMVACHYCLRTKNLSMAPIVKKDKIIGWLFVCPKCHGATTGITANIVIRGERSSTKE